MVQSELHDENWFARIQREFESIQIDDKVRGIVPWRQVKNRDSRVITINPSNAFGTGHHTTTQLCLEILCRLDLKGLDIIDYGCGSDILAICGLKFGTKFALRVEIDQEAIKQRLKNARANDVLERFEVF